MGGRGSSSAVGGGARSGGSSADKAIREASGGVIRKDAETTITATATRRNSKSDVEFDKEVLSTTVDADGNVSLNYAKGSYSGNYGDKEQTVTYSIKSGFVDGEPVNMDLSKASSISGKGTYSIKEVAKKAGMTWNPEAKAWVKKDHLILTKTNYKRAELEKMSTKDVDKIFRAKAMKYLLSNGYSISRAEALMKRQLKKTKSEQIAVIDNINIKLKQ